MTLDNIEPQASDPSRRLRNSNESRHELLGSDPLPRSAPLGSQLQVRSSFRPSDSEEHLAQIDRLEGRFSDLTHKYIPTMMTTILAQLFPR